MKRPLYTLCLDHLSPNPDPRLTTAQLTLDSVPVLVQNLGVRRIATIPGRSGDRFRRRLLYDR